MGQLGLGVDGAGDLLLYGGEAALGSAELADARGALHVAVGVLLGRAVDEAAHHVAAAQVEGGVVDLVVDVGYLAADGVEGLDLGVALQLVDGVVGEVAGVVEGRRAEAVLGQLAEDVGRSLLQLADGHGAFPHLGGGG